MFKFRSDVPSSFKWQQSSFTNRSQTGTCTEIGQLRCNANMHTLLVHTPCVIMISGRKHSHLMVTNAETNCVEVWNVCRKESKADYRGAIEMPGVSDMSRLACRSEHSKNGRLDHWLWVSCPDKRTVAYLKLNLDAPSSENVVLICGEISDRYIFRPTAIAVNSGLPVTLAVVDGKLCLIKIFQQRGEKFEFVTALRRDKTAKRLCASSYACYDENDVLWVTSFDTNTLLKHVAGSIDTKVISTDSGVQGLSNSFVAGHPVIGCCTKENRVVALKDDDGGLKRKDFLPRLTRTFAPLFVTFNPDDSTCAVASRCALESNPVITIYVVETDEKF